MPLLNYLLIIMLFQKHMLTSCSFLYIDSS